jgi:4-hydroxy-L-threonine phosphate dehydrogenase PdxA
VSGPLNVSMRKPIIATMMGDPGGIGPEVAVKAIATGEPSAVSRPMLIGSLAAVESALNATGSVLRARAITDVAEARFLPGVVDVLDPGTLNAGDFVVGQAGAKSGVAVKQWLDLATSLAERGDIDGWIMAPIDRTSLKLGVGMTDDDDTAPPNTFLFRTSGKLRIVPLSEHIRLRDVPGTVTEANVFALVRLLHDTLTRWGLQRPRIALAALNPHARGEEERDAIIPAARRGRDAGIDVVDPVSADSVFRQCIEGKYDVVISMYHDQGQVALKTTAFDGACSIYLGLPYVRLTVPHGSAMDIAGKGIAQHRSMLSAMTTAAKLASGTFSAAD